MKWYNYTVYDKHPKYPGKFVVTQAEVCMENAGKALTKIDNIWVADTLDQAREYIPESQVLIMPDPKDDPSILEIWI